MNPKTLLAAATLSAATFCSRADAQLPAAPATPLAPPVTPPLGTLPRQTYLVPQWQAVRVRNVAPSILAHWLDPKHNAAVPGRQNIKPMWAVGRTAPEIEAMLSLPKGVSFVVGVDEQNFMWVQGSEAGVQLLKEKIALLDTPLRQVEVEAQCIAISDADAKTLGITFAKAEGAVETGLAGPDIQAQIAALIAQNRAKLITAPRVTAIFGQTATLKQTSVTAVALSIKNEGEKGFKVRQFTKADSPKDEYVVGVFTTIGLVVTPTFNADGTLSLQMGPMRTLGFSGLETGQDMKSMTNAESITLRGLDGMPTQPLTLKDQQTVAFRGLNWGGNLNVLVLVTPRIIRRADDDIVAALPS